MASGSASSRPAARDSSLSPDYAGHGEPTQEPACRMPGGRPSSFCPWPENWGLALRGRPGRERAAAFAVLAMTPTVPGKHSSLHHQAPLLSLHRGHPQL